MESLDAFTRAYIACLLFSSTDGEDDRSLFDRGLDEEDIAPEALEKIRADCAAFQSKRRADIAKIEGQRCATDSFGRTYYSGEERAGHDFWFTRNGHGVGFDDRDDIAQTRRDRLCATARSFGACDAYLGDDGKVYV